MFTQWEKADIIRNAYRNDKGGDSMAQVNKETTIGELLMTSGDKIEDVARYCPDKSSSFVVMLSLNVITPQVISVDDNFLCFSVVSLFIIKSPYIMQLLSSSLLFFRILHDFLAVNL